MSASVIHTMIAGRTKIPHFFLVLNMKVMWCFMSPITTCFCQELSLGHVSQQKLRWMKECNQVFVVCISCHKVGDVWCRACSCHFANTFVSFVVCIIVSWAFFHSGPFSRTGEAKLALSLRTRPLHKLKSFQKKSFPCLFFLPKRNKILSFNKERWIVENHLSPVLNCLNSDRGQEECVPIIVKCQAGQNQLYSIFQCQSIWKFTTHRKIRSCQKQQQKQQLHGCCAALTIPE